MRFKKTATIAAALGVVALAGPAFAAGPPYTVTAAGNASGTYAYTATSNGVTFTVHHGTTNQVMTCSKVVVGGNVTAGTSVNPVATITNSTWSGCLFSGQNVVVTPNHNPAWTLWGTGPASTGTNDSVAGQVRGANVGVSVLGGACTFNVTGAANGTFNENNGVGQNIAISETAGNLTISGTSFGCFNVISNGDPADFVTNPTTPFVLSGAAVPVYLS